MKLVYPAVFTPCIEKEGYTVEVPDLPRMCYRRKRLSRCY